MAMTRDDIIRMAHEAGFEVDENHDVWITDGYWLRELERFADLVAAMEREECAKLCEVPMDLIQITDDCSEYVYKDHLDCAEDIRARGQHD